MMNSERMPTDSLPNPCVAVQQQIDDLSQKDLRHGGMPNRLAEHVDQCPRCRLYWQQALAVSEQLDAWQPPEPKRPVAVGVMAAIAQWERDQRSTMSLWRRWMRRRLSVPVPVAAVVLLALGLSLLWRREPPVRTPAVPVPPVALSSGPLENSEAMRVLPARVDRLSATAPGTYVIILGAPPVCTGESLLANLPRHDDAL